MEKWRWAGLRAKVKTKPNQTDQLQAYKELNLLTLPPLGSRGRSLLLQCLEIIVFTVLILTLPAVLLVTELLFYFGTIYIDTKLLGKFGIICFILLCKLCEIQFLVPYKRHWIKIWRKMISNYRLYVEWEIQWFCKITEFVMS